MSALVNHKVLLAKRPKGAPDDACWEFVEERLDELAPRDVRVKTLFISIDPAMRAWLDEGAYMAQQQLGATMQGLGVGEVIESRNRDYAVGEHVMGPVGVQQYATAPGAMFKKIDTRVAPPSAYLGVLGMTGGLTSYYGIFRVGKLKAGDEVVISTAAGAVGSLAGQMARIAGAGRLIGIAGGAEKARYVVEELGFDACIDYKNEDTEGRLGELLPEGADLYFDNVGGDQLDAMLDHLAVEARVVICGAISQYNDRSNVQGPRNYIRLAEKNATMTGFTVNHYLHDFANAEKQIAEWYREGKLELREHVEKGIESYPATLLKLFDGSHIGKLLLQP